MAIHKTLQILNTKNSNEPAYIFTDCINALYLLNTQIQHPTTHNNYLDKTLLKSMVQLLKSRTKPTNLHKVRAHVGIEGKERANELAKKEEVKTTYMPVNHMNMPIHYHITTKERNGHPWTKLQTKVLLIF